MEKKNLTNFMSIMRTVSTPTEERTVIYGVIYDTLQFFVVCVLLQLMKNASDLRLKFGAKITKNVKKEEFNCI